MKKGILLTLMAMTTVALIAAHRRNEPPPGYEMQTGHPNISGQVVFLYYSNMGEAADFYESVMGFETTFALAWVKIYRTSNGSSLGIVDEKKGFLRASTDKPVMVSWITDDVDGWHDYLKRKGVKIVSAPKDSPETGIRSFVFADPGGYSLEFFKWTR